MNDQRMPTHLTLKRRRVDAVPIDVLVDELRRAAEQFGGRRFSRHEFDSVASRCKGSAVLAHFGTWSNALESIGATLIPHKSDRKQISDAQLLKELARVWKTLGHRPSKLEWEASDAAYSYTTYKQRFGGWIGACAAMVGVGEVAAAAEPEERNSDRSTPSGGRASRIGPEDIRAVPLKLRLRILSRDRFTCVLCGRSPALTLGVVLHVDHVVPFSRAGKTTESNLRTLCDQCNWGKGAQSEHAV